LVDSPSKPIYNSRYMSRYVLLKVVQWAISIGFALTMELIFAQAIAEGLQEIGQPLVGIAQVALFGASAYGMYRLLGWFKD